MAAAFQKTFECLTCKAPIKLERKHDNSGWNQYNLHGTPHIEQKKKRHFTQQEPPPAYQQQHQITDLSKEIAAIKAQLLVLVSRLDRVEQEMGTVNRHLD
jgi:hypothetical protein